MNTLKTAAGHCLLPLLLLLASPLAGAAQPADEILMAALDKYEGRMAAIDSYKVVQETMGFATEHTFVRSDLEGRTVFLPKDQEKAGGGMANFYRMYPKIAERATVEGKEDVDGEQCWVVAIDDFSGLELDEEMAMGERGEFVPKRGKLFVDTDAPVIRKMAMEGEITAEGETRPMTAETLLTDYRETDGMLHPYLLQITATGLAAGMSEEEMAQAQKSLAELEKNLDGMDPSEREMVERMMGPQIKRLREMLASGKFEITVVTKELHVY